MREELTKPTVETSDAAASEREEAEDLVKLAEMIQVQGDLGELQTIFKRKRE